MAQQALPAQDNGTSAALLLAGWNAVQLATTVLQGQWRRPMPSTQAGPCAAYLYSAPGGQVCPTPQTWMQIRIVSVTPAASRNRHVTSAESEGPTCRFSQ